MGWGTVAIKAGYTVVKTPIKFAWEEALSLLKGTAKTGAKTLEEAALRQGAKQTEKAAAKVATEQALKNAEKQAAETAAKQGLAGAEKDAFIKSKVEATEKELAEKALQDKTVKSANKGWQFAANTAKAGGKAVVNVAEHFIKRPGQAVLAYATGAAVIKKTSIFDETKNLGLKVPEKVADLAIGTDRVEGIKETAANIKDGIETVKDKAVGIYDNVTEKGAEVISDIKQTVAPVASSAVGSFTEGAGNAKDAISSIMGGESSMNRIGNFFSNLVNGNVSGLGIAGLVAGAMLLFGRSGLMGKISGLLMLTTLALANSNIQEPQLQETNSQNRMNRLQAEERSQIGWGR